MPFSLVPDAVYNSIFEITGEKLARQGITLLLADLDNTLARYGQPEPEPAVLAWRRELEEAGVELFLLSNSRKPDRVRRYASCLDVPYVGHAGKPRTKGFEAAMRQAGRTPAQTAMVGDQIFTDVLGAKRAGVTALMVEPIRLAGNPGRYLRYGVEEPFRALGRRRTRRNRKG